MLDLFSGLGGASDAFLIDPRWSVLRIDNNMLLKNIARTLIMDIKKLPGIIKKPPLVQDIDVIWASPPCTEFSGEFNSPKSKAARAGDLDSYSPDMSLLETALEIIDIVKPKYWVIENVIGSIRYFEPYLGKPKQIIGAYVLWGNFPEIIVDESKLICKKDKDVGPGNPLRSNHQAKVDLVISAGLKKAIENQSSLFDFIS